MLCEPSENNGWSCLILKDNGWEKIGDFSEVEVRGNVHLPIIGGKVRFDKDTCKVVEEEKGKKLICKTKNKSQEV